MSDKHTKRVRKSELDDQIDESLRESFPASDPPSIGQSTVRPPRGRPVDRKPAKIDKGIVEALAKKVGKRFEKKVTSDRAR